MDKHKLKQYRKNKGLLKRIDDRIDRLCGKDIEVVSGKVVGSMDGFPYTEVRTSVQMYEPVEQDKVNAEIRKSEADRMIVQAKINEVDEYIAAIPDIEVREIFVLHFQEGNSQCKIGDMLGYTQGRISQIINDYLKD